MESLAQLGRSCMEISTKSYTMLKQISEPTKSKTIFIPKFIILFSVYQIDFIDFKNSHQLLEYFSVVSLVICKGIQSLVLRELTSQF